MRRTSIAWLVAAAVLAFAGVTTLLTVADLFIGVSWTSAVVLAVVAVALWISGRSVRRLVEGEKTSMTPIGASRVAALAQASAWGGSLIVGYFAAQVLVAVENWHAAFAQGHLWSALAGAAAAVVLVVIGLVVESWCALPPGDDDASVRSPSSGPEPA